MFVVTNTKGPRTALERATGKLLAGHPERGICREARAMCDGWESVGDIAARVVKGVGFASFGRVYEARAQRPPTASPRVMTLLADMSPGWSIAGPRGEAATADGTEGVAGRSPPFGAAPREDSRGRMEREKGRTRGAPGQSGDSGHHSGQGRRSAHDTNTGKPPAGLRAPARN